jgi:hypothetical protein
MPQIMNFTPNTFLFDGYIHFVTLQILHNTVSSVSPVLYNKYRQQLSNAGSAGSRPSMPQFTHFIRRTFVTSNGMCMMISWSLRGREAAAQNALQRH